MSDPVRQLAEFPLLEAIFGRRSRRFGTGMKIPSGPLAFESQKQPRPLTALEQSMLIASGTGMTGWTFGVPHGPDRPDAHAHYSQRFTGRTAPTAAGSGTPVLFYTDDDGTYVTNTRDAVPSRQHEYSGGGTHDIVQTCQKCTRQLSDRRLDLPAQAPHMLPPNYWMANQPGSTLFMPVGDASEQVLVLLAMVLANGSVVIDDDLGCRAGNLDPYIRSGLLDASAPPTPLSVLHQIAYESSCAELSFMAHNIVLTMQAMGLGGLFLAGLNRWSVLGAFADKGVRGLGFRFVSDDRWILPNPVGLDGVYEGLCPPYYPDMRSAVAEFVRRKFGPGGAYDPDTEGPWIDSERVKRTVEPYSDEFTACLGEIAQYIYDKFGRFPGTFTTMVLTGYVQAVHLDTEFYDTHYKPGAYLQTHTDHNTAWH
ncbi:hypothetical protein IEU95_02545 [Hoyosella rhizosphaerae]|uniref:Uncharacterized protein n=1 Tax=Hoyosella rhizosphaerae TaxID=1755582 RepID=A0A916UCR1_9ACTN|nr:hypothetical protein [Hoyosella rhizosphaerae]MBN4925695.1 hypothetical protein [Hoyosella rhizosphaerae]GGC68646.1 hypothetical protein GCM10011410_21770 [Hoyosella rhizosphaerae]